MDAQHPIEVKNCKICRKSIRVKSRPAKEQNNDSNFETKTVRRNVAANKDPIMWNLVCDKLLEELMMTVRDPNDNVMFSWKEIHKSK